MLAEDTTIKRLRSLRLLYAQLHATVQH